MPAAREGRKVLDCADPHIVRYAYMVVVIHAHGHSLATGEKIKLLNRVSHKRRAISPKLSTVGTYSTVIGHLFSPAEVTAMIVSSAVSRPLFVCLFVFRRVFIVLCCTRTLSNSFLTMGAVELLLPCHVVEPIASVI